MNSRSASIPLIASALLIAQPSNAGDQLPTVYTDYALGWDVQFEPNGIGVVAGERERIASQILKTSTEFPPAQRVVCALVVGHSAVNEGSSKQQMQLSKLRAEVVGRLLVLYGIPQQSLHLEFKKSSQPIAEAQSSKNIRVEVEIRPCSR